MEPQTVAATAEIVATPLPLPLCCHNYQSSNQNMMEKSCVCAFYQWKIQSEFIIVVQIIMMILMVMMMS